MNIQDYISSGIIESYVLGLASQEERSEFERLAAQYPELLEARIAFEKTLEKQAMDNAIAPDPFYLPDQLKKSWSALPCLPLSQHSVLTEVVEWISAPMRY